MYNPAIKGTTFSVKDAILFTPPKNTNPPNRATITPVIYGEILKAFFIASPIELACTPFPIKPSANIQDSAKNTARIFDKKLLLKSSSI